jgi:penicillin-insensitive murein endopeptidase
MRRSLVHFFIAPLVFISVAAPALALEPTDTISVPVPVEVNRGAVPVPPRKPEPPKEALNKKKKKNAVAKYLFAAKKTGAALRPRSIGWYAKGCLAGGEKLPATGPAWQSMRLSRNRQWGHPKLIKLVKRLAKEAKAQDSWPGLLVGDISQPRGGPMITGHASHQVGLDADIWLTPMPDRVLTRKERERISATSMLDKTSLAVNEEVFTDAHVAVIKRAASYRAVQRIFVHPAIKKALCGRAGKDRSWLAKVRPLWGHYYHFHIRMHCPNGGCRSQKAVTGDYGCGKEVDNWLKKVAKSLKPKPKPKKKPTKKWIPPSERRKITMAQLPSACRQVLDSRGSKLAAEDVPLVKQVKTTANK